MSKCPFNNGDWILFQGDSITDCGRREINGSSKLGNGYVSILRGFMSQRWPDKKIDVLNRGVAGDRTVDMLARWERDCVGLQAEWLSIMVGCNDVWRKRLQWMGQSYVPLPDYIANYRSLLDQALRAGYKRFVLMSPTTIDEDLNSDLNKMLVDYGDAVKELAREYSAIYVPAREALHAAIRATPEVKWTTDGCHPTVAGHGVIASAWLNAVSGSSPSALAGEGRGEG
ncbi:MAG: SGNH/GDSL hydrolase family protein [Planctomycetota bacterium]